MILCWLLVTFLFARADVQISGVVLNGSADSAAVANIEVKLLAFRGHDQQLNFSQTTATNRNGQYIFAGIPADSAIIYYISVDFEGVSYYSTPLHYDEFSGDRGQRNVVIYQATDDLSVIDVPMHHIFFQAEVDMGFVREVVIIRNNGTKTIVTGMEKGVPARATLRLPLPSGTRQLQLITGLDENSTTLTESILESSGPIVPGTNRISFAYQVPGHSNRFILSRELQYHTNVFSLFTYGDNLKVESAVLAATGPFTIRDVVYHRYAAESIHRGNFVDIGIIQPRAAANYWPASISFLGITILLSGIARVFTQKQQKLTLQKSTKKDQHQVKALKTGREALIQAIAGLDNRFALNEIAPEVYNEERQALFTQLLRVEALKQLLENER